jgi:hypothetical protein
MKGQEPQADGKHVHFVYKASEASSGAFGTGGWEEAWRERLKMKHWRKRDAHADLKTDATLTIENKHWYLDLLLLADKRFLDYHNNTDTDTYILTIMNMAADVFHDVNVVNLDIVVVCIIYRHKQEELDPRINQDTYASLGSFCKRQMTVNPNDEAHRNHQDIAFLLTRVNICANKTSDCSMIVAAYTAEACNANLSCVICKDTGLFWAESLHTKSAT